MVIFVIYGKFGTRKCWINESPMKMMLSLGGLLTVWDFPVPGGPWSSKTLGEEVD